MNDLAVGDGAHLDLMVVVGVLAGIDLPCRSRDVPVVVPVDDAEQGAVDAEFDGEHQISVM